MLHPHAQGEPLGLQGPSAALEDLVDIPGGMPRGEDNLPGLVDRVTGLYLETAGNRDDVRHPAVEMVLSPVLFDAQADILHDSGQLVCPQVRMRVDEDGGIGPEPDELVQHFPDVPPLGRTREQFSVGKRAGTAFTIAVIGIRVDDAFHG